MKFYAKAVHSISMDHIEIGGERYDSCDAVIIRKPNYVFDVPAGYVKCIKTTKSAIPVFKPDSNDVFCYVKQSLYSIDEYEAIVGKIENSPNPSDVATLIDLARVMDIHPSDIIKFEQEYFSDFYE